MFLKIFVEPPFCTSLHSTVNRVNHTYKYVNRLCPDTFMAQTKRFTTEVGEIPTIYYKPNTCNGKSLDF